DRCPTTVSNEAGRYLRADTTKFSIIFQISCCKNTYFYSLLSDKSNIKFIKFVNGRYKMEDGR
ncbi:MAG: hypothetical protein LBV75_03995, partial [Paludibacter sp.]|nr:hypothetical protein [Paludibacter sp.]